MSVRPCRLGAESSCRTTSASFDNVHTRRPDAQEDIRTRFSGMNYRLALLVPSTFGTQHTWESRRFPTDYSLVLLSLRCLHLLGCPLLKLGLSPLTGPLKLQPCARIKYTR